MVDNVRPIDRINGWHPVVKAKRKVFIQQVGTFVWTTDDTD
jgi:hypothetical protein